MSFQDQQSSTAHRREVHDLREAGLNPILSGTGGMGAASSAGAMAQMQNVGAAGVSGYQQGSQAQNQQLDSQIKLQEESTARSTAQIAENDQRLSNYLHGTEEGRATIRRRYPAIAEMGDAKLRQVVSDADAAKYSAFDAKIDYDLNRDHEQAERIRRITNRGGETIQKLNPLRGLFQGSPSSAKGSARREPYLGRGIRPTR